MEAFLVHRKEAVVDLVEEFPVERTMAERLEATAVERMAAHQSSLSDSVQRLPVEDH